MTESLTLIFITCKECGESYGTKCESHNSVCPTCGSLNPFIIYNENDPNIDKIKAFADILSNVTKLKCLSCNESLLVDESKKYGIHLKCDCGFTIGYTPTKGEE